MNMEPGLYEVTYTPYWDIGRYKTDTVRVREDGKHEALGYGGRFYVVMPYGTEGFDWVRIGD